MEKNPLQYGWTDEEVDKADGMPTDSELEYVLIEEELLRMVPQRPSLLQLCMHQAAMNLSHYAHNLEFLPSEIATTLVQDFLGKFPGASLRELEILCETFSRPQKLCLSGVQGLNTRGMQHLSIMRNLVRLDLRGCSWLENLTFLPALKCLECLNLRDCWYLPGESLSLIRELPQLQCLDVENVSAFTDDLAAHTLSELRRLHALNVSGTCVGDRLVEVLTYGSRLHAWVVSQQAEPGHQDLKLVTQGGQYGVEALLSQWPVSNLTYLRLQRTHITHAAVAHLLAIPDLLLLDVRLTNVTGKSIFALQAKHKLVALPNNAKVAARTNSMLAGVLEGECGCRAMARQYKSSNTNEVDDELMAPWEQAPVQLLQRASIGRPYWP